MEQKVFKASAPGNIFFVGEYAAVHGRPAICAAVGKRTYAKIKQLTDAKVLVYSKGFGQGCAEISGNQLVNKKIEASELSPTFDFLEMLLPRFNVKQGFELEITSQVPPGSGMSSSTALLSAVFKAVCLSAGKDIPPREYFDYLYPLQVKIHGGRASGAEIVSSALGGFNKIQKIEACRKTELKWQPLGMHKFSIIIGDTKISTPTSFAINRLSDLIAKNKRFVFEIFDEIAELCKKAESALEKDDEATLGKLMNKNQEFLSSLGVSHPKLDECIDAARKVGALGAKLSGKGMGGIMFALTTQKNSDKVLEAIKSTGADAFKTEIGGAGVL